MEAETKRVLPEEILEIFKELNLTPITGCFKETIDNQQCACGMGAYYLRHKEEDEELISFLDGENLHIFYRNGYFNGFDGEEKSEIFGKLYALGYKDGLDARNLLIENGFKIVEWWETKQ